MSQNGYGDCVVTVLNLMSCIPNVCIFYFDFIRTFDILTALSLAELDLAVVDRGSKTD